MRSLSKVLKLHNHRRSDNQGNSRSSAQVKLGCHLQSIESPDAHFSNQRRMRKLFLMNSDGKHAQITLFK